MYAVEMSGIAEQARQIVADNGYSDRITLLQAKVEEITLPVDKARAPRVPKRALQCVPRFDCTAAACSTQWNNLTRSRIMVTQAQARSAPPMGRHTKCRCQLEARDADARGMAGRWTSSSRSGWATS